MILDAEFKEINHEIPCCFGDIGNINGAYANQNVSNAVKGNKSGENVSITDISPLPHNIITRLNSKNLLPYPHNNTVKNEYGITFTDNGDGTITSNGTATELSYYDIVSTLSAGEYVVSGCPEGGDAISGYFIRVVVGTQQPTYNDTGDGCVISLNKEESVTVRICIRPNTSVTNLVFKPQIEIGTIATEYTPYVDLSSVKLFKSGKNLIPYPYSKTVRESGITFTDNGDGSITINGTNNGNGNSAFYFVQDGSVVLPKGNIAISGLPEGCTIMGITTNGKYVTFGNGIGTLSNDTEFKSLYLQIASGNTTEFKNVVVKPMFEKGTKATQYEPCIAPTEYTPNADGTANVSSLYPTTRLYTDTSGVTIEAEYNKDLMKVIAELQQAVAQLSSLAVATIPLNDEV